MGIIQLTAADHERIVRLWRRAGLHYRPKGRDGLQAFSKQLASGVQAVLGIEREGRLIGVIFATHDGRKGWLNRLVIDPSYRRTGMALALIKAAEEHLHMQGIEVTAVLIETENRASRELFAKAGYHEHLDIVYASKRPNQDS